MTSKIVFTPSGLNIQAETNTSLLCAAQQAGVAIRSLCGGNGKCRQCWVRIIEGTHPKHGIHCNDKSVSPVTDMEHRIQQRLPRFAGMRLACRAKVLGDVVVDVPESSQEHATSISKTNHKRDFAVRASITQHKVCLPVATLDDNPSACENLLRCLAEQGISARANFHLLASVQDSIELAGTHADKTEPNIDSVELCAVLRQPTDITGSSDLLPEVVALNSYPMQLLGASIDLGSTTLALYLHDLATGELLLDSSAMNPQIKYGEDLMSRVSYVMMHPEGAMAQTTAVREKLGLMLQEALKQLGAEPAQLLDVVMVGNPIMHHLFFGLSPVPLGQAPFTLTIREWLEVNAADLNLAIHPSARVAFLPLIAGHVGADTAAAYLSEIDKLHSHPSLLVDIGTNAEIVLVNEDHVLATSSPTGPAFEGAEISAGVRATYGAIERVRIDPNTFDVRYKLIGNDAWSDQADFTDGGTRAVGICGSGIIETVACLARVGLIDQGGLFVQAKAPQRFDMVGNTVRFLLVDQGEESIYLEQTDVRAIQLAKAALYAGVQLLMDRQRINQVDQVLLAGAFGSHCDPEYIADLDLIPNASADNIRSIGNAAGVGASMALLSTEERRRIIKAVRQIEKIESANQPKFQDYFVEGMSFSVSPVAQQQNSRNRRRRRNSNKI